LNDQYGNGGISYLTGFYHKPRQEMRIFMFLDMRSSTAIAERLGHNNYFFHWCVRFFVGIHFFRSALDVVLGRFGCHAKLFSFII
jgi:hypothetical protein